MPLQLIDDGYTLEATVKARGYPAVAITYRTALPAAVRDFIHARTRANDGKAEMKSIASLLTKHVQGWDIVANGQPAPVTEATINRVPDPVLHRLIDVVTGYAAEDAENDEKN